jgi:hypothetical protein
LLSATLQAIVAAFGAEGTEVIAKTNDYLNRIAQTDPQRALLLAGFINEDPMLVCSLVETSKTRWLVGDGKANVNTGIPRLLKNTYKFSGLVNYANVTDRQLNGAQGYVYFGVVANGYQIAGGGNAVALSGAKADQDIEFEVFFDCPQNKVSALVNGATYNANSVGYSETPANATLWLYSLNDNVLPSICKIADWSIEVNTDQVTHFIPMQRTDGTCGMLDIISGTFYPNANTQGSFTIQITDKA